MTVEELQNYYKSSYAFGKATKMSPQSYTNWIEWGFIPIESQRKIEALSSGGLKADLKHGRPIC
jgi:hypothetical protein